MPALVPPRRPDEIRVDKLDVIGHADRGVVSHVGFAWTHTQISHDNQIAIVDARTVKRTGDTIAVHAIGRLNLSRRERMLMATWLERYARARTLAGDFLDTEGPERDPGTGRIIGRRDSCAGLVHACVRACLGVDLVDLEALPKIGRQRLVEIWGERGIEMAEYRGDLTGDEPWRLLLPGHILHALAHDNPRARPLRPLPEHWDFQ